MDSAQAKRVIVHIDVDCFYAQVEESRRPELKGRPLGIYQKFLVVTCNYPARNAGVAKMCPKEAALRVCPDLVLVNGEDLTPYRAVSKRILEVMRRFGVVERRGMDEAYLDVTEEVHKRMALAAGPNPVYRGFVGKVLAGPIEKAVFPLESCKPDRTTDSQAAPRGEPALRLLSMLNREPTIGGAYSEPETAGGLVSVGFGEAGELGGALESCGGGNGRDTLESMECEATREGATVAELRWGRPPEATTARQGTWEELAVAANGSMFAGTHLGPEATSRYVPPGWRPLMRAAAVGGEPDDVSMGGQRNGLPESRLPELSFVRKPSPDCADLPLLKTPNFGAHGAEALNPEAHNPGCTDPAGALRHSAPDSEASTPGTPNPDDRNPRAQESDAPSAEKVSPALSTKSGGVHPFRDLPVNPLGRVQYSSLTQAFGSVLNPPPEKGATKVLEDTEPPRKKARSEPGVKEVNPVTKTPSWLDWRNEADPGLPPGASPPGHTVPSPGHNSPGKGDRGKLPGHWSDVRQVRFQAPAPDGVLKTTEKLDFGADVAGSDWLLLVGSHVAAEVREAIWAEVGCRCSAGVAHNKMLAKLASPMNKPNGQTTMLAGAVAEHIRNLPARKIPGIGWSYDAKLREMKIDTIGDLQKLALSELEEKFGPRVGSMIYHCCRGEDTSAVEDKGPPKSLSVEDSFRACLNLKQAEGIVKALAPDYIDRLDEERDDTGRRPKTLTVKWRLKGASYQGQSTSGPMPLDIVAVNLPKARREESLVRSAMALLSKAFAGKKFHLVKLNVGATNFVEEAAKGTPSLLSAWAGRERNGTGAERNGVLRGEGGVKYLEENLAESTQSDRGAGQNKCGAEQEESRFDSPAGQGLEGASGRGEVEKGTSVFLVERGKEMESKKDDMAPDVGRKVSLGGESVSEQRSVGLAPMIRSESPTDLLKVTSASPPVGKSLGSAGAIAGSVLHANLGSKREARASREAAEGVKPVLGNGHEEAKAPWLANPGGLGDWEGAVDTLGAEWDLEGEGLEESGRMFAGRGFGLETGEESDEKEDLWEDLQSVRLERRGLRADGRSGRSGSGPSARAEDGLRTLPRQLPTDLPMALLLQDEVAGDRLIKAVSDGQESDGKVAGTERNGDAGGSWGDEPTPGERQELDEQVETFGRKKTSLSKQGVSLATSSLVEASFDEVNESLSPSQERISRIIGPRADALVEASLSASCASAGVHSQSRIVITGKAPETCSTCGETLAVEPNARRAHADFHVAMKLQKQEEKIGRLFKEVSSRGMVSKGALTRQSDLSKPSRVLANGQKRKGGFRTLEALWKRK